MVRRENIQESDYKDYFKQFDRSFDKNVKLMQNPILELSSTEIRECLNVTVDKRSSSRSH